MRSLHTLKQTIKSRLGELWWYTLLLFIAHRMGEVVNAVVGLGLVPKYVPKEELGAVLPLASVGGMIGLPLTILLIPFTKFLARYMAQGEYGKVKALLRDMFVLTAIIFVVVSAASWFFMPLVFERMRVENGSLSMLIILSGIIGALAPIFSSALQALKKFSVMSVTGVVSAGVRLATMLVFLPIRGLSGYFVGQITPNLFNMGVAFFALRRHLGRGVRLQPYQRVDGRAMLRYTAWVAFIMICGVTMTTAENFVIRQRLPDIESAGYYMVSRFAEIVFSFGTAISTVLFPLVCERQVNGNDHGGLLRQSIAIALLGSVLFTIIIVPGCALLFRWVPLWNEYQPFISHLTALCLLYAVRGATHCFVMYEIARERFRTASVISMTCLIEMVILVGITGYGFFAPWLPTSWMQALTHFNPCRLWVVMGIMCASSLLTFTEALFFMKRRTSGILS